MAGLGVRFVDAGYSKAKPFIDVAGKPMILRVLDSLGLERKELNLICILREEHVKAEPETISVLRDSYGAKLVTVTEVTEGPACTVLLAEPRLAPNGPLLVVNSDQIFDMSLQEVIDDSIERDLDGSILTFVDESRDPKWSYAATNDSGFVTKTAEKEPISKFATVGVYLFRRASEFVRQAKKMIDEGRRSNKEFYVAPVYNYFIAEDKRIGIYNIPSEKVHIVGTPQELERYLKRTQTE